MSYRSRIPRAAAELFPLIDEAFAAGADVVAEQAKVRVPVETGKLRAAIHVERIGNAKYAVVAGNENVFYGHIVEHGGVRHAGQPFLIPALEDSQKVILGLATRTLKSL